MEHRKRSPARVFVLLLGMIFAAILFAVLSSGFLSSGGVSSVEAVPRQGIPPEPPMTPCWQPASIRGGYGESRGQGERGKRG